MDTITQHVVDESSLIGSAHARMDGLLGSRAVTTAVQSMVDLETSELVGHELLARPRNTTTSPTVRRLLEIAESQGRAAELSRRMRRQGLEKTAGRITPGRIFLNTHPSELADPQRFLTSLRSLAECYRDLELVAEIPEHASLALEEYVELRDRLHDLGVAVAFDEFGAGRSRLLELATAPPDYIKFACSMIRGIDERLRSHETVLDRVVEFIHSIGALPIAVGVETHDELEACRDLGFSWAQGFHVGRPWTGAA
jgi:EAL domain-containing protein (putative c-di-GMP-specific phosphodiesterase class I)